MFKVRASQKIRQHSRRIRRSKLETLERRQLLAAEIPDFVGDGQIGVVGAVQVSHEWATITLDQTFVNPVVIAGPASSSDPAPVSVRVRNVDSDSFQISVDEWDYLDGPHAAETVSYLVVEGGTHRLTDGKRLVAGYLNDQTQAWTTFSTDDLFSSRPVLLSQIMTENDAAAATTRAIVSSNNDFQVRIQEEEAADGVHGAETVGFVLIDSGVGSTGDQKFQAFITSPVVTHQNFDRSINGAGFDAAPALFADMQTTNGTDPATVGLSALSDTTATIFIDEEQSSDSEVGHGSAEVVGGLAIEPGGIFASLTIDASDRFDALEQHILGSDTMTFAEFKTWSNTFDTESGTLGDRVDDFVAAVEVVELYESNVGPLFTSQGISSFNNDWPSSNDGRGLERSIFRVYQAIFDAIDDELIRDFPDLVDTVMFRSTENFPGSVPSPTDPLAVYQVSIDGTLEEQFGSPGGYDTNEARRMTGAYLAPGSIAEVIVPPELVNAGFTIRVGGHSWDLSNKNSANRLHRVSNQFAITSTVTQVANPMGGNIYIEVPVGADAGIVDVQFRNTIRAPFFSDRSFDKTSESDWENIERDYPGAFTDIESEHTMWTVPSKWVRDFDYDTMMEMIEAHDAVIQTLGDYVGKPERNKAILYMIVDTQIRGNAFSIGYPQSNYGTFSQSTRRNPLTVDHAYDRVLLHEHGHAEYFSMFAGETESINHMLATAVGHKLEGLTLQRAFGESLAYGSHNHTTSDTLSSWVVMDEFLSGTNMAYQQASYRPRGHADYVEYVELFGWEAIENFNLKINQELDGKEWTVANFGSNRTSHNTNDRILRLSIEAGVNVAPLFHLWGHSPSNQSQLATAMQAAGLGPSVGIYDRMIEARNSVPQTQAEWNAVNSTMKDFLNDSRGPWEELRTGQGYVNSTYNGVSRSAAAVARIDALIALYFPDGRPEVVDRNTTPNVVLFDGVNFHGQTLELTEGRYANVDLDASLVRNNGTSSISIPEGFEVRVFNFQFADDQATYTTSMADLGDLNNRTSSLIVSRATIDGLSVDIGGITAGTQYDQLITNAGTLDGTLNISLTDSFIPSAAQAYTIVDSTTDLAGEFDNVPSGQRMETTGGEGSFVVTYVDDTVVLSDFVRNETSGVVFYDNENFHGYAWELTEGTYGSTDLDASPIGNNAISSITIPEGYEVTIYDYQQNGTTVTYTASTVDLGAMDNKTSSFIIGRATIDGLSVDIGGTTAGTQYDQLITNAGTLAGSLAVSLTDSFVPSAADSFTVVDSTTNLAGAFENVASGERITTGGGEGTFLVTYDASSDTVVLSDYVGVAVPASIVGRGVAYRGATAAYGESVIDPTKSALREPGAVASMANYTNYTQGLNRIVIDIDDMTATTLDETDFEFRTGNTEDFGNEEDWTSTQPSAINVELLTGSTKRVTIDWPHKAIMNQWLEVTVKANSNTNLDQDDVFYFGNQVGDVDGSTSASNRVTVNAFDTLDVKFGQSSIANSVGIGHLYDLDRSGAVNAFDTLDAKFNQMSLGGLFLITLPLPSTTAASQVAATSSSTYLQNPENAFDVNGDGEVTSLDALVGINFLSKNVASSELAGSVERQSSLEYFYDVNGDGYATALDSLQIINALNAEGRSSGQGGEATPIAVQESPSDHDDELDWVSDDQLQQDSIFDLALSNWNEEE
ncbi:M60 family peptidase N-terminal accessory domain-containing protein [Neorhodopirellula lusitana]|uniref:M60 family peptidase N-terminal accessory domain-containing protein n=1 Tax=Neorhodopirellula lusitana TaxID=445327 RepID=UPI003850AF39